MENLEPVLSLKGISKHFPGVKALDDVSLDLFEGKVTALLGENGAGKSTLMKIISGVYTLDAGEILYQGVSKRFKNPREAQEEGITIIHQELNLIQSLSIGENIFLGREPRHFGKIHWSKLWSESEALLGRLGLKRSPKLLVSELSLAEQQLVEIAKALSFNAKVIIMDESHDQLSQASHKVGMVEKALGDISEIVRTTLVDVQRLVDLNGQIDQAKEASLSALEDVSAVIEESAAAAEEIAASLDVQDHLIKEISDDAKVLESRAAGLSEEVNQFKI